jgi:hypothetical protein
MPLCSAAKQNRKRVTGIPYCAAFLLGRVSRCHCNTCHCALQLNKTESMLLVFLTVQHFKVPRCRYVYSATDTDSLKVTKLIISKGTMQKLFYAWSKSCKGSNPPPDNKQTVSMLGGSLSTLFQYYTVRLPSWQLLSLRFTLLGYQKLIISSYTLVLLNLFLYPQNAVYPHYWNIYTLTRWSTSVMSTCPPVRIYSTEWWNRLSQNLILRLRYKKSRFSSKLGTTVTDTSVYTNTLGEFWCSNRTYLAQYLKRRKIFRV